MRLHFLTILFLLSIGTSANAQINHSDSIKRIARKNVAKFKLDKTSLKIFRKNKNDRSDLFKPTILSTMDVSLLNDSAYNKKYRELAFNKTLRRKTSGHYILVVGTGLLGAALIVTTLLSRLHPLY